MSVENFYDDKESAMKSIKQMGIIAFIITTYIVVQPKIVIAETLQVEGAACVSALSADPELVRIKNKVGLSSIDDQTFEMKTSKAYPTASEKKIITLWAGKLHKCYGIIEKSISEQQSQPSMVLLIKGQYPKLEYRLMQLYDKKISYGEFARARDEDQSAFLKKIEEAKRILEQEQEQERRRVQNEKDGRDQEQRQLQQEQEKREQEWRKTQSLLEENKRVHRCQVSSQNAASFCNPSNQGNVNQYLNGGNSAYRQSVSEAVRSGMNDSNCTYWSMKTNQDCR